MGRLEQNRRIVDISVNEFLSVPMGQTGLEAPRA